MLGSKLMLWAVQKLSGLLVVGVEVEGDLGIDRVEASLQPRMHHRLTIEKMKIVNKFSAIKSTTAVHL